MRRPALTTSHRAPRVHWMTPTSPGDLSPMDRLVSWLEHNGEEYQASKHKVELLEQLDEEMVTNGIYGLSVSSIRSQITRLKNGVRQKAEGGKCSSKDINHYFDRLLPLFFKEVQRLEMRERAEERATTKSSGSKTQRTPAGSKVLRNAKKTHSEDAEEPDDENEDGDELPAANLQRIEPILDTTEIRRRFELLSARQELQKQGVDPETIDSMLPLG